MRDNGWFGNFDMILIETKKCENSLDAKRFERKSIEELNAMLNMIIPTRTKQEYRDTHREETKVTDAIYRATHQSEIK